MPYGWRQALLRLMMFLCLTPTLNVELSVVVSLNLTLYLLRKPVVDAKQRQRQLKRRYPKQKRCVNKRKSRGRNLASS